MSKLPLELAAKLDIFLNSFELESLARRMNFVQRKSAIIDGQYLLRLFTFFGNDRRFSGSLEEMTAFAHENLDLPRVSKQSLHDRLTDKAVMLIAAAFVEVQRMMFGKRHPSSGLVVGPLVKRILIGDTTKVTLPNSMSADFPACGGRGSASKAGLSLFYEFDLMGSDWDARWADGKTSDKAFNDPEKVRPGDLLLRDMGFRDLLFGAKVKERGGYFIQRFFRGMKLSVVTPDGAGKPMDLATFAREHLEKAMKKGASFCSFDVQLGLDTAIRDAIGTLRLVAFRIPEEKAMEKIVQARKEAKRNGRTFTKAEEILCRYQICFTNLPQSAYSDEEVIALYRLRWQVELRFKSWKSRLNLGKQPIKQQKNRLLCQLWGFLLYQLLFVTTAEVIKKETEQKINSKRSVTLIELSYAKCIQLLATNHHLLVAAFARSPQQFVAVLTKLFEQAAQRLKLEKKKPPKTNLEEKKKNKNKPKMSAKSPNHYRIGSSKSSRKIKTNAD